MSALETCDTCGWGMIPRRRWKSMTLDARKQAHEHGVRDKYGNGMCRACSQRVDYTPKRPDPAERLEDVRWMADTGEHLTGAAARLGITEGALSRFLDRHDPELRTRLLARNPRDHNAVADGSGVMAFSDNEARRARNARHNAARRAKRAGVAA